MHGGVPLTGTVFLRHISSDSINIVTDFETGDGQDDILNVQGGVHPAIIMGVLLQLSTVV